MKCTIKKLAPLKINERKLGMVVEGFLPMDSNLIPSHILNWIYDYNGVKATVYEDGIKLTSTSTTICSNNDEFNKSQGFRIAESKAKIKLFNFIRTFSDFMYQHYYEFANSFDESFVKYSNCSSRERDHLINLGNINESFRR